MLLALTLKTYGQADMQPKDNYEWFSCKDLSELQGLPNSVQGLLYKAKVNSWKYRDRTGKGGGKEYHINSLPKECLPELFKKIGKVLVGDTVLDIPKQTEVKYCPTTLWKIFEQAGSKSQEKAKVKIVYVKAFYALLQVGCKKIESYDTIAKQFGISVPTVRRETAKVKNYQETDWLAVLITKHQIGATLHSKNKFAQINDDAWKFFKSDYLRLEQPAFNSCYYRLLDTAKVQGWDIPSVKSLKRRLDSEVTAEVQILLRKGEHALTMMHPPQRRTVQDIEALEWINGDGYKHNVFVEWWNGEPVRPVTWFWQDIRTRKIVGYRCDISENTDSIRFSLMDVIKNYGIPKDITIDNTRAAANKALTGGKENRYRFKVKKDDPIGLIPLLNINIHWTSIILGKGHGQAKPIERAFGVGGMEEYVDKHPLCAGGYTGPNPTAKPDNYNEKYIPVKEFLKALDEGVQMFNARINRQTEICQGVMSFDEAFERDFKKATVRRPTAQQLNLFMLSSEPVTVSRHGTITLKAGGKIENRENRYSLDALYQYIGKKIVARFEPDNLHNSIQCYDLQGVFIGEAECIDDSGFGSRSASRESKRHQTQFRKANKKAAKAQELLGNLELAEKMRKLEDLPESPSPAATEIIQTPRTFIVGNTVRKVQIETEQEINVDELLNEGVTQLFKQKQELI